jgi:TolA-binding protein
LETEIKRLNDQINQMNVSIEQLKKTRQRTINDHENMKQATLENKKKIKELNKVIDNLLKIHSQ